MSLTELDDGLVRSMAIGAVFSDFGGKIRSVGFHRTDDLLVTSSEDDSLLQDSALFLRFLLMFFLVF
ncbi:hypothetical protein Bca4012_099948 [Brassica carinata]|uniref:Uncharacterized protein n=2 Tax=Brassica TaxID=3705 RepID=A0A8X7PMS2_BRACI|nr:hypothetical protein Bca52824_082535 [Brassica carinata]VDD28767.1 unnamed protein product [Brassica oleracea]